MHVERRVADGVAVEQLLDDVGLAGCGQQRGQQSWWHTMPLATLPAGMWPGQRMNAGTRQPPSQLVFFSDRNGVMPASGQLL